jgi:hypothetical protein
MFNMDELRAEGWLRLHELSEQAYQRPRTVFNLKREIFKAMLRFLTYERQEHQNLVRLLQALDVSPRGKPDWQKKRPIAPFSPLHCAPYSVLGRLKDSDHFSGLKTWHLSHLAPMLAGAPASPFDFEMI